MDKDEMNEAIKRAEDAVHLNGARAYYLPEDINLLIAAAKALTAQDVNAELLEALKMAESFIRKMSGGGETDFRKKLNKAIAIAEAQKVGE